MLAIAKAFSRALGGRGIETLGVRAYAKALGDQSTLPLSTGRPRLVILGTGWGGARLARDIDPKKFDITIISPRNHMVFTPLIASSCVGTLEPRSVTVPITDIQPALRLPQNNFLLAECDAVHTQDRLVECSSTHDGLKFFVQYDVLAIATGSQGSTFGIPGVTEYTMPLRDAANSTDIRTRLIQNWGESSIPGRSPAERARLLHVCVVGGGPTGVEFAGELADFVRKDLAKLDPNRARDMRITLIEADQLLSSFDARLREYAALKLTRAGVHLVKGIVKEVRKDELELKNGAVIPYGLCVWSTGVGPTSFSLSLPFEKTMRGRLAVDDRLRVLARHADGRGPTSLEDVSMIQEERAAAGQPTGRPIPCIFGLGDVAATQETPLPALAQVAEQQGRYLARALNEAAGQPGGLAGGLEGAPPFQYHHLGSMASVGGTSAVIELGGSGQQHVRWSGFTSWIAWRSAYLTRLGTMKHRLYVMSDWTMSLIFGRDVSKW
ncbi:NDA1 [Auxenochlorella protothecoides x Auxenochlorella symbiontica]|uniref:NADH:ubiquinone reductase (non-electrogenic) n=3 Tax=Auxenochlorella protothecoides TaxID=3075 RepID=A0A1D2A0N9_AUXPR